MHLIVVRRDRPGSSICIRYGRRRNVGNEHRPRDRRRVGARRQHRDCRQALDPRPRRTPLDGVVRTAAFTRMATDHRDLS